MMTQLFRLTFVAFIWKRYKQVIVSTLVLLLFLWIIEKVHQDFVHYSQLNADNAYLGLSFVIKWLVFVLTSVLYLGINVWFRSNSTTPPEDDSLLSKMKSKTPQPRDVGRSGKNQHSEGSASDPKSAQSNESDPFDAIRHKERLRSKADLVLQKPPKK